ncbi:hypothetical protein AB0I28_12560 [Phytomonospora sp. NPDC050363]|uniref:hypothetical protein n=1 Tax=Phytomonospora sp. NPDC050363 TaxID=3155642 RepID=UPI0033D308E3
MYEVYPRGHAREGKRRFKRCVLSLRKGTAKTELAAAIAFAELHPEGPVRTDGFRKEHGVWVPVGRPVTDPYIPMVAYTEEQTEELAYAALHMMCSEGADPDLFDIGLDRILRLDDRGRADGKATALASSPDARDGARTTFQHVDEPHRWVLPRQVEAHETMLQNIPKRPIADPWTFETSTPGTPGDGSVQEASHEEAEQIASGKVVDGTYFFFHREAAPREGENLDDPEQLKAAIREASGPAIATWEDFEGQVENIASLHHQAKRRGNEAYFERVWLGRRKQSARQAFDSGRWKDLQLLDFVVPKLEPATLGFDGSKWSDATGLVLTTMDGHQSKWAVWEHDGTDEWEVDETQVDLKVAEAFDHYSIARLYGDPAFGWSNALARWSSKHGTKKVFEYYTDSRNTRRIATAVGAYAEAIRSGAVSHDGDEAFARHIGKACRRDVRLLDEHARPLWTIEKERSDSPFKIDLAMCGVLSWQAYLDAMKANEFKRRSSRVLVIR